MSYVKIEIDYEKTFFVNLQQVSGIKPESKYFCHEKFLKKSVVRGNLLRGSCQKNIFCIMFWCLAWGSNPGSNGDFKSTISFFANCNVWIWFPFVFNNLGNSNCNSFYFKSFQNQFSTSNAKPNIHAKFQYWESI